MEAFEEYLRLVFTNSTHPAKFVDYLRKLEAQAESDFVRMMIQAMIEAITGPHQNIVTNLDSLHQHTDDALLFNLRCRCNSSLSTLYKTNVTSRMEMCRFFGVQASELPFKLSLWLQRHSLDTFKIIGMYRRPDSIDSTLTDILVLLLTSEGLILQLNMEDMHLYKVCHVENLDNMEVGLTNEKRYNYLTKDYLDESNCQVNMTRGVIPYKKFEKPKISR